MASGRGSGAGRVPLSHAASISVNLSAEGKHTTLGRDEGGLICQVNEYLFVKDLGRGSEGEVSLCRQSSENGVDTFVAVKTIEKSPHRKAALEQRFAGRRPRNLTATAKHRSMTSRSHSDDDAFSDKLMREIAIMKKIVHPCVVRLIEVIDVPSEDTLFIVMEYAAGDVSMRWDEDSMRYRAPDTKDGVLPPVVAARYMHDLLRGLAFLHRNGIAHKDLKPDNILITEDGRAKISDFGLSAFLSSENTTQAVPEGTWGFWSPDMCSTYLAVKEDDAEIEVKPQQQSIGALRPLSKFDRAVSVGVFALPSTLKLNTEKLSANRSKTLTSAPRIDPMPVLGFHDSVLEHTVSMSQHTSTYSNIIIEEERASLSTPVTATSSYEAQNPHQSFPSYNMLAADTWAAGVCLWVFLYGTLPFYDPSPTVLIRTIASCSTYTFPSPPEILSQTSDTLLLRSLLLRLLERDPDKRITAAEAQHHSWLQELAPLSEEDILADSIAAKTVVEPYDSRKPASSVLRVNRLVMASILRYRLKKRLLMARETIREREKAAMDKRRELLCTIPGESSSERLSVGSTETFSAALHQSNDSSIVIPTSEYSDNHVTLSVGWEEAEGPKRKSSAEAGKAKVPLSRSRSERVPSRDSSERGLCPVIGGGDRLHVVLPFPVHPLQMSAAEHRHDKGHDSDSPYSSSRSPEPAERIKHMKSRSRGDGSKSPQLVVRDSSYMNVSKDVWKSVDPMLTYPTHENSASVGAATASLPSSPGDSSRRIKQQPSKSCCHIS